MPERERSKRGNRSSDERTRSRSRTKKDKGGGSDRAERGGVAASGSGKAPLERQTSNNEDSMAMLLGLAGKKKPRRRDSNSSSSSSDSSQSGPPITGEKTKTKQAKDGPLLKKANEDETAALDLSNRSGKRRDDDTGSFGSSGKGKASIDESDKLSVSKLGYPTVTGDSKRTSKGDKNDFVSRPDLRNVDQSVNLKDHGESNRKGKGTKDYFKDTSTTSYSSSSSSNYGRGRNKRNPYLKASPMESFLYSIKSFCVRLRKDLCHKNCLALLFVIVVLAVVLPFVIPGTSISSSKLIVPEDYAISDTPKVTIDTIQVDGITYLAPVVSNEQAKERFQAFHNILLEHGMDTVSNTNDPAATQALEWMAQYDPAITSIQADQGTILQRYALAVLFFATHPNAMANRTTNQALNIGTATNSDSQDPPPTEQANKEQDERRIDAYGVNWMMDESVCVWQGIECLHDSIVVHLNLSSTALQGTLPVELTLLKELTRLDLSNNFLQGTIPDSYVDRLDKLEYLLVHDNLLTGHLPLHMGDWSHLTYVNLAQNKLSGPLPESLNELVHLQLLFLQENLFSGSLPSMEGLESLEYFYANNNDFSGTLPDEMFEDKALIDLRLEYNNFVGSLPETLHKLHALEVLSLGNNDLNGTVPDVFKHNKNLIAIDLHKNRFSGTLPTSLGELTAIEHILMDNNELTGTLANDVFSNLATLRTLVLHHNNLEGSIHGSIHRLKNLQELWLNNNKFTGTLPDELGECTQLVNLYLHDNEFDGTVPSSLGQLEHLGSLRLYHNLLRGEISPELCQLKENEILTYLAVDCESSVLECECCDKCY